MDGEEIYYVDQQLGYQQTDAIDYHEIAIRFKQFLQEWLVDNAFFYREQIIDNGKNGLYYVRVNFADIENFDIKISMEIRNKPLEVLPVLEQSARELFIQSQVNLNEDEVDDFQVQIFSEENPKSLRLLNSDEVGKMIKTEGIIIKARESSIKGKKVVLECKYCGHKKTLILEHGFTGVQLPSSCETSMNKQQSDKCSSNPYQIVEHESTFIDQQVLTIQETSDSIPNGETPRNYRMCVERYLCDHLIPGNKVSITGVLQIRETNFITKTSSLGKAKSSYIYVTGFKNSTGVDREFTNFTKQEEKQFEDMAKDSNIFESITESIGSQIFGNGDIKQAIACLLFGGSSKMLPDGTKLRGDINVLLIGDPSTAKSQFLKFVYEVAPICIYTSGKGSSAAGLTATIVKDNSTGQFQLEGGALVLADGGVVCIDEFDKMRSQDRIAIHEAMEQQTISIAKAGITTILNSRTSILAAANPIHGSYISYKSKQEQIDLQSTILSRFDCIFTVVDQRNEENDRRLAQHVIKNYMPTEKIDQQDQINYKLLKRYINYARMKCFPRLDKESAIFLQNLYVQHREKVKDLRKQNKKHIPITVRQLEAIIRLSESIAKMRLSSIVTKDDVTLANNIFEVSTMNALKSNSGLKNTKQPQQVLDIEDKIRQILDINSKVSAQDLTDNLEKIFHDNEAIEQAITIMIQKGELKEFAHSVLKRIKQFNKKNSLTCFSKTINYQQQKHYQKQRYPYQSYSFFSCFFSIQQQLIFCFLNQFFSIGYIFEYHAELSGVAFFNVIHLIQQSSYLF